MYCVENHELAERNATLQRSLCAMEQRVQQEANSWKSQLTERDDTILRLEQSIHDLQQDIQHRAEKVKDSLYFLLSVKNLFL
jgi:phage shock protein A